MILADMATLKHPKTSSANSQLRRIEGRHNPLVKELRKYFAHPEAGDDGLCAIEGWRILEEAIRSGLKFRAVFFSALAEARAERLLPQLGSHVEKLVLPDNLFTSAVATDSPQGVAALVRCRQFTLDDVLTKSTSGPVLAVAGVQDPGNLGTILRSAEAFEAAGVLLGEGTVSALNWKTVRASAGSVFRLPSVKVNLSEVLPQLREHGLRLVATSSHKGTPLPRTALSPPVAIFVGSEGAGVPRDLLKEMDETIAIPHSPKVESLNAGMAAGIVLYEAARQRE
jgi:RNA methyltransferase, TrmH family